MHKLLFVLASVVLLSGCANTTFHTLADPDFKLKSTDTLGVLPLNVIVSLLDSYPGEPLVDPEQSRDVALGIDKQLRLQLSTLSNRVEYFLPRYVGDISDKELRQTINSHEEIELSIMSSFFRGGSTPLKHYKLDKSIHSKLIEFRDTAKSADGSAKIRYLIAITVAESFSSPKRFRELIGATLKMRPYLGERINPGIENGGLSIIDLETGEVVWNITRGRMRDIFDASSQAAFVASMLDGLPLK